MKAELEKKPKMAATSLKKNSIREATSQSTALGENMQGFQ